jgi:hypothetical protein
VKYINSVVITDSERDVEVERMSMYILNEVETSRHLISQNYMKIMRKNLIGIANLHISTIVLLNAGTVPTV